MNPWLKFSCFFDSFRNLCSSSKVRLQICLETGERSLKMQMELLGFADFGGRVWEAIESCSKRSSRKSPVGSLNG